MVLNGLLVILIVLVSAFSAEAKTDLAQHRMWLLLGHYQKSLNGYSSPLEKKFFLHPDGSKDPVLELQETIKLLFSTNPSERQLQCKYPARTEFLKKELNISSDLLDPCPLVKAWKDQLNVEDIFIVFASNDLNSISSGFGHTFLRLKNRDNFKRNDLLDYGVNYSANTGSDSGAIIALRGLFGQYGGYFSMLPFHQKMIEYTNLEGRDLWEYRLKLNPEQIDILLNHLLEIDGIGSPYYFMTDNCSQAILELLALAYPDKHLETHYRVATFPLDSVKILDQENLIEGDKFRTSLRSEWLYSYKQLSEKQKDIHVEFVKNKSLSDHKTYTEMTANQQAQILESTLKYLAIEEYRDKKDLSTVKYEFSLARAKLGRVTEPLKIEKPFNPLQSSNSSAYYLGHGVKDGNSFTSARYRWAYQDVLSKDWGLTPFAHIEVFGLEARYLHDINKFEIEDLALIKLMSLDPSTRFAHKISWHAHLGFEDRFSPLLDYGVGSSLELNYFKKTRVAAFMRQKNILQDSFKSYLGPQILVISDLSQKFRVVGDYSYMWNFERGEIYSEAKYGVSLTLKKTEIRFTSQWSERTPEFHLQFIF